MAKFKVEIIETLSRTIEIDRDDVRNANEAIAYVEQGYNEEKYVLDADDYVGTGYKIINN